jgi:hypothetical protein
MISMTWSTPTPPSPMEGEGVWCRCVTDLPSALAGATARCRSTTNLPSSLAREATSCWCNTNPPSPLAGEGQGGGKPAFRAMTEARSWPLRSPVRFVTIRPLPSGGFGPACVSGSSKDGASGDKLPSGLTLSTSRVSQPVWSSRLMAASTAGGPSRTLRDSLGSRPTASRCSASGTTRYKATWMGSRRLSDRPYRIERGDKPPPRPSPTRGEGGLFRPLRDIKDKAGVTSAPNRDGAQRSVLVPGRHRAGGTDIAGAPRPKSLLPCGGGLGWGVWRV